MKTLPCLLTAVTLLAVACAPSRVAEEPAGYRLHGRIAGVADAKITVQRSGSYVGYTFEDVAEASLVDGRFEFVGAVPSPELCYLQVEGQRVKIRVFVENSDIEVESDLGADGPTVIRGSLSHDVWLQLKNGLAEHDAEIRRVDELLDAAHDRGLATTDPGAIHALEAEMRAANAGRERALLDFVGRHPTSPVAAYAIVAHLANTMDHDRLAPIVAGLDPGLDGTRYVRELRNRLDLLAGVQIGRPAPDFASLDRERRTVHLSDFRGSWVLVDFWASWCAPCRRQNPSLIALRERYRERGFEILGVALEFGGEEPWHQAIAADGLTWPQVSELRGYDEEAARIYAVRAIPFNVLVDPEGRIVARSLRDEELADKVEALLGSAGEA